MTPTGLSQTRQPNPTLRKAPAKVRTFRVRLELLGVNPPVWRLLELPGNITLPLLHDVIQAAMGWTDSHLHRFRTGRDRWSPYFVTDLDLYEQDDDGVLEDNVRLDQLVTRAGNNLWYEYDFGDCWDHVLKVEEILNDPPTWVGCTDGRRSCPPEDCGGNENYEELANWVRSGSPDDPLPDKFDDAADARDWVQDWDPDHFDVREANAAIANAVSW